MAYVLGVDLGTTFTAAAVQRDGTTQIASLGSRGAAIPSVVLLRDDETVLTGEAAERRAMTEPDRVAREFKRRLGDQTPILLAGTPYSAEALTSRLLRSVVDEVSTREGERPERIAVTHPANWGAYKIDLLEQAIRIADVGAPVSLISEPEAAAISYASQQRLEVGQVVAVFDLGGGTFDAAVLRRSETGFEILGEPEGIERLGGIDFDAAVFAHVARSVGESLQQLDEDDPAAQNAVARLRADCVEAKEALSADTDAAIPVLLPNLQTEVRITRSEFEAMIRPSLVDAIEALRRALRGAGVEPGDVAAVLLVGGSSRIPLVAQLVGAELGRPVAVDAHPKHAIATGAAVAAAELGGGGAAAAVAPPPGSGVPEPPDGVGSPVVGAAAAAAGAGLVVPAADTTVNESLASLAQPPAEPAPTTPLPAAPAASSEVPAAPPTTQAPTAPPPGVGAPAPAAPTAGGGASGPDRRGLFAIGATVGLIALAVIGFVVFAGGDDDSGEADPVPTEVPVEEDPVDDPDDATTGGDENDGEENGGDTAGTEPDDDTPGTEPDDDTDPVDPATTVADTTTTTTTLPPDEDCEPALARDRWVCLTEVALDGDDLVVTYEAEFLGEALSIGAGLHLHVFGNHQEPEQAGNNLATGGSWEVIEDVDEFRISLANASVFPEGTVSDKICAVVADARPERVGAPGHNWYDADNGNCLPIPTV